jgi:hypothetical protein
MLLDHATGFLSSNNLLSAGTFTVLLRAEQPGNPSNISQRQLVFTISPVRVTSNYNLPWCNSGRTCSGSYNAAGGSGNYTWTILPDGLLPQGLFLNANGTLSGSTSAVGSFNYHVSVSDGSGAPAYTFWGTIAIYPAGMTPPVTITTPNDLGTFGLGTLDYWLSHDGGDGVNYTWTLMGGSLPPGVALRTDFLSTFHPNSAAYLGGVLAQAGGPYTFTLRVSSGGTTDTRTFTMRVSTLTNKDAVLPDAYVGNPYNFQLSAVANSGPVTYALDPNFGNPSWLHLAGDGTITGMPDAHNNTAVWFTMTDNTGTVHRAASLRISAIKVDNNPVLPNALQGTAYNVTLTASEFGPPTASFNWSTPGGLPAGISISPDGVLSAANVTAGPGYYWFQLTVSDPATGQIYTRQYAICVVGANPLLPQITPADNFDDWPVGNARTYTISAWAGVAPYTWSATGLPDGISIRRVDWSDFNRPPGVGELWGSTPRLMCCGTQP